MNASPDDIQHQQTLLATHRRTLATLLVQQAQHTTAFAPPVVAHGITEARAGIARCKATLRGWGVAVDDHPNDAEPTVSPSSAPSGAGDTINAPGAQGFVNRPADPVYQHFGDIAVSGVSGTGIAIRHKAQAQVQVQQSGATSSTDDQARDDAPALIPLVSAHYDGIPITVDEWRYELARKNEIFGKPAGYWCYVRPGTYKIGGWGAGEASANIALRGFWIAKYPVTVAQYAAFIEAGGYNNQRWWTPNGWAWKQGQNRAKPSYWGASRYNGRSQLVIEVTWYEAVALAAWLHERALAALPDGYRVRLPTKAEWEAAAAYDERMQRRTYPWGEQQPTPEHAVCRFQQGGGFFSAVRNSSVFLISLISLISPRRLGGVWLGQQRVGHWIWPEMCGR